MALDFTIRFRASAATEDGPLRALLESVGLPVADVATGRQEYLLALDGERLIGAVGLEVVGEDGLLRSLAVVPALVWRRISLEDIVPEPGSGASERDDRIVPRRA